LQPNGPISTYLVFTQCEICISPSIPSPKNIPFSSLPGYRLAWIMDRQNRSHHFRQAVNLAQFSCLSVGTGPNCLPSALVCRLKTYLYRFSTIFSTLIKPKYANKLGNSQCMEQARPENQACHLAKPVLNDADITRGKHEYIA
jgi:hypothetical protein